MTPVFIFSLPRAGSTLLQRMLMGNPQIASVSEPWLLLPLVYMLPGEGEVLAPYNHEHAQTALADLVEHLPRQKQDYCEAFADLARDLYGRLSPPGTEYFLDKTPRYYLIIPQIAELFPEAKFIFLFRNPLAISASIVKSFGEGRLGSIYGSHIDLTEGPVRLITGYRELRNRSLKLSYEELIQAPEQTLGRVLDYLGLDSEGVKVSLADNPTLTGIMGDKSRITERQVDAKGLSRWKDQYRSMFRHWLARKYLESIAEDVFDDMGYPRRQLLKELEDIPRSAGLGMLDIIDYTRSTLYRHLTGPTPRRWAKRILIPKLLPWR